MTKRRVRLGIGLDHQKLSDTIQQAFDAYRQVPGLSLDAHDIEDGWLHLMPKTGFDAGGEPTEVIGWLLTFAYPYADGPEDRLSPLSKMASSGVKLAGWEAHLYASYWLPAELPFSDIADVIVSLLRDFHAIPPEAHVEVALEFGL